MEKIENSGKELSFIDYNICAGDHLHLLSVVTAGDGVGAYLQIHYDYIKDQEEFEKRKREEEEKRKREEAWMKYHPTVSYEPAQIQKEKPRFWRHLFERLHIITKQEVCSSIFAPFEIKPYSHFLVQVYLHLEKETETVKARACESQRDAVRRDNVSLRCYLEKGDKVDILLNIYESGVCGNSLFASEKKSVVWQGSFTKCSFDYYVGSGISDLMFEATLIVKDIPVGNMKFITYVVESPRQLNPEVISHKYQKVFISYAHKDEVKVRAFHEGLKLFKIDHFFDRAYLKAGDVFPQVIQDYIDSADLFVLFWSENAANSEYVQKEREQALARAYPQVKPAEDAKLSIYPMSIEPRAELPEDMKYKYHFGEM